MGSGPSPYSAVGKPGLEPIVELAGRAAGRARGRRFDWFQRTMRPEPDDEILDVGCGGGAWSLARLDPAARVTGVDRVAGVGFDRPHQRFVIADACALPFGDDEFDIGFSNSVIEHIDRERRADFAAELRRVARRYWVQTPNRWFPIEPHALLPAVQLLPERARRLAWRASPRRIPYEDSLELLARGELAELFDDALIFRERIGPLTKSLIAVGPREAFRPRSPRREAPPAR
jgi:SAM-dependent methyltransferase